MASQDPYDASQISSPGAATRVSSGAPQAPRAESREAALQQFRKSMGSTSKDAILLLRMLSLDLLSPRHAQAFLEALDGLDRVPQRFLSPNCTHLHIACSCHCRT